MRLTDYIKNLGPAIAYYPNLKKVTHSTTASILLCQLLYWTDKTTNGWIDKTQYEIEDETGLTYNEQKTARKVLRDLGILFEKFKRIDRTNTFWINQKALNDLWDNVNKPVAEREETVEVQLSFEEGERLDPVIPYKVETSSSPTKQEPYQRRTAAKRQGDLVDGQLAFAKSKYSKEEVDKDEIRGKISTKLHINVDSNKWEDFIKFVYVRQTKYNEPVERFISWVLENDSDARYWTPARMKMLYPQAFIKTREQELEEFVAPLPEIEEKEVVPPPEDMRPKRKLY